MISIKTWMDQTRLKMNPFKTEFFYFGHPKQLTKCTEDAFDVTGDLIVRRELIRYLGVWMDSNLNLKIHATKKCQVAMINFIKIRNIRHLLDANTTESLCLSLCISHLDYCNAVLYGLPDITIHKMQRIQNMCACLVLRRTKRDTISTCLKQLHWLPVQQRIHFKLLVLMFKCLAGDGPVYLKQLLHYKPILRHGLRSSTSMDNLQISTPRTKSKTFADHSFSVAAPTLWNSLPYHIRSVNSVLTFKKLLKTHLFSEAYPS